MQKKHQQNQTVFDNRKSTWSVVQDPQVLVFLLLRRHDPEEHVPRRLAHAVERPAKNIILQKKVATSNL